MRAPRYYKDFRCLAEKCTHSCCVGWEIDVDEDTLALYRSLPAPLGEEICHGIVTNEEGAHFALDAKGRCPNLDERGLCRIIKAFGEGALCDICREHPRFYNEVGGETEVGIGASCEAAARLILSSDAYAEILSFDGTDRNGGAGAVFDTVCARTAIYETLKNRARPFAERRAALAAAYGYVWQDEAARALLSSLEYMENSHRERLLCATSVTETGGEDGLLCERFLAYLIYRHASPQESAEAFSAAVRMALFLVDLFARLLADGLDGVQSAILLSEEIEYSEDNVAALLTAL